MLPADASQAAYNVALPVKNLIKRPPVLIAPHATVAEAAAVMQNARIGSVLVSADPLGIVTDRDLRGRVLAAGLTPDTLLSRVMTQPVKTLDSDAPVIAALLLMLEQNIHHLPLVEEGRVIGVISGSDLLQHQARSPIYLRRTLDHLNDPLEVRHYAREITITAQTLFQGGIGAVQIGQIVSSLNDALVMRLVGLAEKSLGPPPAPFAWIVFGSEGRLEQTLLTDQDNALIHGTDSVGAQSYFAALAQRVVDGLIQVGFPPCPGGYMATNWHKPLHDWQHLFTSWVRTPEPKALLDAAIFFDFRPVAGTLSLAPLEEILVQAGKEKLFVTHMAETALQLRPPLGFFNRIRNDRGMVDLKLGGIGPIVALARLGALATGSRERSTLDRLVAAASGAIIRQEDAMLLSETFEFLLHLRLRRQLAALQAHERLDHKVHLIALTTLERRHLKEAFVSIRQIQADLRARLHLDS